MACPEGKWSPIILPKLSYCTMSEVTKDWGLGTAALLLGVLLEVLSGKLG